MSYELGDIYLAHFPLEEDNSKFLDRPVIIVVAEDPELVVIKITKTAPRASDPFDVPIIHYRESGLKFPSTARVSKVITIAPSQLLFKIGKLHSDDLTIVIEKLIEPEFRKPIIKRFNPVGSGPKSVNLWIRFQRKMA